MVFQIWSVTDKIFCRFGLLFALPFYIPPLTIQKIKILKTWKKPLELSSFYTSKSTKNHDHMLYCSLAIFQFFTLLPPWLPKKSKFGKSKKKTLETSSSFICVPKIMIRWCTVLEIWCVTDVTVIFHSGPFFALLPP